jgi:hypothetical protein
MKPGPNYKMSSLTKMSLATILDPQKRGEWKRAMIQAELAAAIQPKREPRKQGTGNFTTHGSGTVSSGG